MQEHLTLSIGKDQSLVPACEAFQFAEQGTQVCIDDHDPGPLPGRCEERCGRP